MQGRSTTRPFWTDFEQLIDRLPAAVYVCEAPDGVIRLYNRKAAELWGREPRPGESDARFCGSLRLWRPDGSPLPHDRTPMAEVLQHGGRREDEVVIERPDGSRVTVEVEISALLDADGRVVGAVNVFQDVSDRQRVENELRLSEARYRAIVEDQIELVCRFRPDGTMTFVNESYCRYFGVERGEILASRYVPVIHPDDLPQVEAALSSLGPDRPFVMVENRVRRADGAVRWTRWTNRAIHDGSGTIVEVQATGRDVTERKQAEEVAARLAAVVESAEDAIVAKTLDGIVTSWNRGAERLFGYTAAEVVGRSIGLVIPPERRHEEQDILDRLRRGEATEHFETERVRKDGRRVLVALTISPVFDASGAVIGASKIARDITEQKRAARELATHATTLGILYRLADLMARADSVDDVCEAAVEALLSARVADRASVLVFDAGGVMRFRAWRGLSEAYRAAVDGHSPWEPDAREPVPMFVEDALADPSLGPLRDVVTAEGIRALGFFPLVDQGRLLGKFMVYHETPHAFGEDETRLLVRIARDVAAGLARVQGEAERELLLERERRASREAEAARAAAERASRGKDEFLAMLAHELRNPLGVISNAVAVLEAGAGVGGRALGAIHRQTEHLGRLLDDLLDVARITSGRIELARAPVDLRVAVDRAVEGQEHRIAAKRQRLDVALPEWPVLVHGDAARIQQVLGNLLDNATKYTPEAGSIRLGLEVEGAEAVLRVRDDGIGIAPDQLETVFDLFAQANPTPARTDGGLGIGLTLVRRIVELHGGTVRASSEGPGRGAELEIRLAVLPACEPAQDGAVQPAVATSARRVLVIEDHDDAREMLVTLLRLGGHEVLEAATGTEGLALATRHRPQIALVDIGLPDIVGYEVGARLRGALGDGVRIVALTGYGQPGDRARSVQAGFDAHLVKPVDPDRLAEALAPQP